MTRNIARIMLVAVALLALAGCGGQKEVIRTDAGEQIDLSGNWNDTDAQKVSAALATQISSGAPGPDPTVMLPPRSPAARGSRISWPRRARSRR